MRNLGGGNRSIQIRFVAKKIYWGGAQRKKKKKTGRRESEGEGKKKFARNG